MSSKNLKKILENAQANNFIAISELMTGIETGALSRKEVSSHIFKHSLNSIKIGITGPPGAGKSSLMNQLIPKIREKNLSVGIIAIDPSSPITGGSFLGDRVRINNAVDDNEVFVRSMGSRAELGGVTDLAEDFSDILAFSGKDIIFIETVGIGQSEYSVSEITDLTTLVFVPESGDEIQLLKAGILELADVFVVNKSDRKDANLLVRSINNIISATKKDIKKIPIFKTSCKSGDGIADFATALIACHGSMKENDQIKSRQLSRFSRRMRNIIEKDIIQEFWSKDRIKFIENLNKEDIKFKSPYEIVDNIKKLK
ncbi:MAG: GTP-binding protein [Candidatus Marinimicrobia bacterium]|jgi:LAO/AO transport system kinase|nr:GTP-binding protein [Candidatus Neomarinimicrobiota bacterium]